jgi:hypothetical protein
MSTSDPYVKILEILHVTNKANNGRYAISHKDIAFANHLQG